MHNLSKNLEGFRKLKYLVGLFKLLFEEIRREITGYEVSFVIFKEFLVDFGDIVASN